MGKQIKLNVKGWAEQCGYSVEVDRHGVYTNYNLRNTNGLMRIERDTVKGHTPWIVCANYKLWIPERFGYYFSSYTKDFTVVLKDRVEYADLTEYDIMQIISNNK
jgi:hypothetical protein